MIYLITLLGFIVFAKGQEAPKVGPLSAFVKPVIGGRTSYTCQSLFGSLPFQFSWFKDGKELFSTSTARIRTNEELSSLIIDPISSSHSGNYTCKISNRYGSDSYSTELKIEGPPLWVVKPKDVTIRLNETFHIKCIVSGYPKPKIEWKKLKDSSWAIVTDLNSPNIQINENEMIINKANHNLTGKYGCSISNGVEPNLWTEFQISVEGNILV